ncbi:MAG TPA: DUF1844 domain-containing protein [candidate division Zixibacteria bacterium]|nr:DUF1844 domain-containing protein [candidate division Zixibacteria bacterium]
MSDEKIKDTETGMLFYELLLLLRQIVRSQLGYLPNPETGEAPKDVESARHLVDMIAVLEEKTKGNLNEQEKLVLDNLLTELRMACVRAEDSDK